MPQPLFAPPHFREREMTKQLLRLQAAGKDAAPAEPEPEPEAPASAARERAERTPA